MHRGDARELVKSLALALGWPAPARFPSTFEEQVFLERAGAYVSDGNAGSEGVSFQGLLAWEQRFGACEQPASRIRVDPVDEKRDTSSCAGRCGRGGEGDRNAESCWCDEACHMHGDCCADFAATCTESVRDRPRDFIDAAVAELRARPGARVRDLVLAVKDRLTAEPVLSAPEERLVASLFGAPSLDVPLAETPSAIDGARRFCGVLAKSPAFLLRRVPPVELPEDAAPTLVSQSYATFCESYRGAVEASGWSMTCRAEALSLRRPWFR